MSRKQPDAAGHDVNWRDIAGYGGAYQVSRDGGVRSWKWRGERRSRKPKNLSPYKRRRGNRYIVKLTDAAGKTRERGVMGLVADAWLGGCPAGKVAYHLNGDKGDNAAENIGFVSRRELGRMTGGNSRRIPVAKIGPDGEAVAHYPSARAAGRENHMSYQTVLDRCHGRVRKPFALDGYSFEFDI